MGSESLQHAIHNESACDYLMEKGNLQDWVITTSFYSALHYLRYRIFPIQITINGKNQKIEDFESYCISQKIYGKKHNTMRKLVEEFCSEDISAAYNQMLDLSWTARYNKYKFSSKMDKLSRRRLTVIANYAQK